MTYRGIGWEAAPSHRHPTGDGIGSPPAFVDRECGGSADRFDMREHLDEGDRSITPLSERVATGNRIRLTLREPGGKALMQIKGWPTTTACHAGLTGLVGLS